MPPRPTVWRQLQAAFEAKLAAQAEAFEAKLGEARQDIAKSGHRHGLVSKDVLESEVEELLDSAKPHEMPRGAFEKVADAAFSPLLGVA